MTYTREWINILTILLHIIENLFIFCLHYFDDE